MKKIFTYIFALVALFGFASFTLAASYAGPTPGTILHTDYPTSITSSGATLNATILGLMDIYNSTGQTTYFQYGTSESNLNLSSTPTGPVQGTVSATVTNLTANTTYYFRIVADFGPNSTPANAKEYGGVLSFTTASTTTDTVINCVQAPCDPLPQPSTTPVVTTTNTSTTTTTTTSTSTTAEPITEVRETPSIAGCGNRTSGFSTTTGQSCIGNIVTVTFHGTHINNQNNASNTNTTTTNNTATTTTVNQNSAISIAQRISINLTLSSRGASVSALQNFLIEQNKGPAARALAQTGATGYFGILTRAALAEFQASVGIRPSVGYFGALTRAYINAQY